MPADFGPLKTACAKIGITLTIEEGVAAPITNPTENLPADLKPLAAVLPAILKKIAETADKPITIKFNK